MSIKYAILGLLADRPMHGYDLKTAYESELVPTTQLNYGQVYTTLERLARDGLVAHELVSQDVRPDKKVYALTREGRRELRDWLKSPSPVELDLRNETFLRIILAQRSGDVDPFDLIAAERRASFQRLHDVSQARAQAERDRTNYKVVLLLDLAVLRLEAFLKWLDRCEEVMSREKPK